MRRRTQVAAGCIALFSSASLLQTAVAFVTSGRGIPAWDSPTTVKSSPRSSKDATAQLRRHEGTARRRGRARTDLSALPVLESLSLFDTLPTDVSSAASSTSSLLGSIANAEAMDVLGATKSAPVHSEFELLEYAELWSILAMSCIVALLVAWEESIEVRPAEVIRYALRRTS